MKRIFAFVLIAIFTTASLVVTSCDDDDGNSPVIPDENNTIAMTTSGELVTENVSYDAQATTEGLLTTVMSTSSDPAILITITNAVVGANAIDGLFNNFSITSGGNIFAADAGNITITSMTETNIQGGINGITLTAPNGDDPDLEIVVENASFNIDF